VYVHAQAVLRGLAQAWITRWAAVGSPGGRCAAAVQRRAAHQANRRTGGHRRAHPVCTGLCINCARPVLELW